MTQKAEGPLYAGRSLLVRMTVSVVMIMSAGTMVMVRMTVDHVGYWR